MHNFAPLVAVLQPLLPIAFLFVLTAVILFRVPVVNVGHTKAYRRRRFWNWFPLGMTYAFLYMGRYNLTVAKNALGESMSNAEFGTIFCWGTLTYGCAFMFNGPLADRWGGRRTMLISTLGSAAMNILLGAAVWALLKGHVMHSQAVSLMCVLYAVNMYFQSFGAVSLVKVNSAWFHRRERGVFGGIFGTLIALGMYFAFDWGRMIATHMPAWWLFEVPAVILCIFFCVDYFLVRDIPSHAGHEDFDTDDASSGAGDEPLGAWVMAKRMLTNPVIVTIAVIEFCGGFLRNAIMHWYLILAQQTGHAMDFVPHHWGFLMCVAGILGGVIAGSVSDHLFAARRGPVICLAFALLTGLSAYAWQGLGSPWLGAAVVVMSAAIIGVHSLASGTAAMDFGGRKNAGFATGFIDGFVYLGTAVQSVLLGGILPDGDAAQVLSNWKVWPITLFGVSAFGALLAMRLWNAQPNSRPKAAQAPALKPVNLVPPPSGRGIAPQGLSEQDSAA